jgi:predicted O-linked N-acetylglucosamine transferase (SPINDLY family)
MTDFTEYFRRQQQQAQLPSNPELIRAGVGHLAAGRMAQAEQCFRIVLSRDPNPTTRFLLATMLPQIYASHEDLNAWRQRLVREIAALQQSGVTQDLTAQLATPMYQIAYHGMDDRAVQQQLTSCYRPPKDPPAPPSAPGMKGRIRVGFISAYLRDHTIGRLNHGLIEKLNRGEFHVTVFGLGNPSQAEVTQRVRKAADAFVPLTLDLPEARRKIRDQRLDVLFFCDIGMEPWTYTLSFSRLAPVQCVTWGHPDTTGVPTLDYFISSEHLDTPDAQRYFTEKLVRLPLPSVYYYRPQLPANPKSRADFGLPPTGHLYGCPQTLYKFHPDFDIVLSKILRADPEGILVLIHGQHREMDEALMARFRRTMPDVAPRVRFVPRQDRDGFLSLNNLFEVSLDPLHFGGGNTSFEALALGVPIVTLPSPFLRGRITFAQYQMMGMTDCIAADFDDYVAKALRLGTDREHRREISQKILQSNSVLYENAQAVRDLEQFFKTATGRM